MNVINTKTKETNDIRTMAQNACMTSLTRDSKRATVMITLSVNKV